MARKKNNRNSYSDEVTGIAHKPKILRPHIAQEIAERQGAMDNVAEFTHRLMPWAKLSATGGRS